MAISASAGPTLTYGITVSSSGATGEYNDQRAPSLNDLGSGMLDPRSQYGYGYQPGQGVFPTIMGFYNNVATVDFIPSALSTNSIALSSISALSAGAAITLTASGVGVTVVSCIIAPETGKLAGTLLCIDTPCGGSTAAYVPFGQSTAIGVWNPASVCGRGVTMQTYGNSSNDVGVWTIAGRDVYGFKVTETITASTVAMNSLKTYKYISAITAPGTLGSTGLTVGTADLYGFPMLVQGPQYVNMWFGATSSATYISANTGNHTFGSSRSVATSSGGDVRGTYASTVASNGTSMRVYMQVTPMAGANSTMSLSSYAGLNQVGPTNFYNLFGATQFSSV